MDIDLGTDLTVVEVSGLRERLLAALESDQPLRVDAAAVEMVDGAAIQLLLSFHDSAAARGIEVQWGEASPALREAIGLLGVRLPFAHPAA